MKQIKSLCWLCWAGVLLALVLVSIPTQAADRNPPDLMTYQGYLVDNNGTPLGNTAPKNYDVVFRIWSDQAPNGSKLWTEQQTITIDGGYFSVLLGEGATYSGEGRPALSSLFAATDASDRYIEIMVKGIGTGGADLTIAPRLRLLTSPYAFLARTALNAQNLANNSSAQIVTVTSTNVGINQPSPTTALDVKGTVTATGLAVNGPASISGANVLEFGKGVAGKDANAGKIGYNTFDAGLDICGAGPTGHRLVSIWAEDGTVTLGGLAVNKGSITSGYALDVNGAAKATSFSGYGTIPIGGIIMWYGSLSTIPAGWALCNGQTVNGYTTPNLTNRFVLGASLTLSPGATGGSTTHALTANEMPAHYHDIYHAQAYSGQGITGANHYVEQVQTASAASPYHSSTNGLGQAFSTVPPYYALAYIMRYQ